MDLGRATALRICELCRKQDITFYVLAIRAGIPPSTLNSILEHKSKNPGTKSIKRICIDFDITLSEFYHSELFD
ncbi:helix-turn-helix domain-containing protein [Megamonas hypermegale]|uniref:helix-turn-helix domain-containing protein n=1 Tax=Megamonas hypermegale TaxID=158847 RepID=UPI0026E9A364|nr:helix-turn-helix transcriptional regulator [Megamonas hypermegale]